MGRSKMKDINEDEDNAGDQCWKNHQTEIVKECHQCKELEKKVHDYCVKTGFKEKVKCIFENGTEKYIYKSCPRLEHLEERGFWTLEGVMTLLGLASYAIVHLRQSKLNKDLMERVHKQIAAGV